MASSRFAIKRCFDLCSILVSAPLWLPLTLVVAAMVRWKLGAPIFFVQARPGLHGRPFNMLKFRTMRDVRLAGGEVASDAERLTPFGQWLRATSLDELPELLNVLKGDMSLVGPRPLLMEYLPLYSPEQARRHDVPPGITGWAQVNGRNSISWDEKLAYDVWYVDHGNLRLDLRILYQSAAKVWRAEGVSQAGHVTTEKFRGSSR
jgi:sugar transferase EpsL